MAEQLQDKWMTRVVLATAIMAVLARGHDPFSGRVDSMSLPSRECLSRARSGQIGEINS